MSFYGGDSAAYERGKQRRIMKNARIGRGRRFDANYPGLRERINTADARVGLPLWIQTALTQWNGLTDKQAAVAIKILDTTVDKAWDAAVAENQRRATTPVWTAGRQSIEGQVVSVKWSDVQVNRWHNVSSLKGLVVLADGRKLWVTIPSSIQTDKMEAKQTDDAVVAMKGETIRIAVTVQPKQGDETFAFGKRPSAL